QNAGSYDASDRASPAAAELRTPDGDRGEHQDHEEGTPVRIAAGSQGTEHHAGNGVQQAGDEVYQELDPRYPDPRLGSRALVQADGEDVDPHPGALQRQVSRDTGENHQQRYGNRTN